MSEETRPRAWQRMLSGRRLDLLDPDPADIEIGDIAHGLARVARWNGQTVGTHAFSVAQHSLVVEEIAAARRPGWPDTWRCAALLHDAPEFVIGDLISPFKAAIGLDYKAFEARLLGAIHRRFGLPAVLPPEVTSAIKDADRIAARYEAIRLAGFSPGEAEIYFGHPPHDLPASVTDRLDRLAAVATGEAQAAFLARFGEVASAAMMIPGRPAPADRR